MRSIFYLILCFIFFSTSPAFAANRVVNLVVSYKVVDFAGKRMKAIAVNDQIPAPTLHFKQGDHVTINVYNKLDKGTAIHWHGILVPWQMDGVEGVTQKAIPSGGMLQYQFTLEQSGTYWYHAHAGLQEQQGLYGAFLIDPPHRPSYKYTKDYAVVLSDWSNTYPEQIFANLKKEGDYYSQRQLLQPSLFRFMRTYYQAAPDERKKILVDYKMMQQMRMSIYDISDIAYDAFLLNGQTRINPWIASVKVGDVVRLRFIGAAASTNYRVKIPGALMQVVHVQGNDVKPYFVNDFFITPGETYDVLVKIQENKPYIIYAESADTLGAAIGALITSENQHVNYKEVMPFPEPQPVTREMMDNMSGMNNSHSQNMGSHMHTMHSHAEMNMPTEPSIYGDKISKTTSPNAVPNLTTGSKYQDLVAAIKTNDPHKPVNIIKMELFGYMHHFIWMINGLPEYKAHPIVIEPEKRYRIVFINNSMMHHPMHIHGHFFILRNGHNAYDPLLHTIDVGPGATVVADFDTDASGQWFFHCHHLYHMAAGMSRVFQYSTILEIVKGTAKPEKEIKKGTYVNQPIVRVDEQIPIDPQLIKHPMAHSMGFYLANFIDVGADPFHNSQRFTFKGLYGGDYNKLNLLINDAEVSHSQIENADLDIFYWRLISQFWAIKGGANYFNRPASQPYWQPGLGIEGMMPYFIDTNLRSYYHRGSVKLDLELSRDTQITNNFFVRLGIRTIAATKTVLQDSVGNGLNQMRYIIRPYYRIAPGISLFAEYECEKSYGTFKKILRENGNLTSEDTITLGIALSV